MPLPMPFDAYRGGSIFDRLKGLGARQPIPFEGGMPQQPGKMPTPLPVVNQPQQPMNIMALLQMLRQQQGQQFPGGGQVRPY